MSQIHIYGSDPQNLNQAKNYANRLRQQHPDLEDGRVFTDFWMNQRRDLWDRTEGRELWRTVNPGDVVIVARHTDFWTVSDAKRVRENWTHRGIGLHIADLEANANEINIESWGPKLRSAQTRAAMDRKRSRGEKLGGFSNNRPGYKVVRSKRLGGKMVKYWRPDREQMPILRYIAFIRDSCLMRKRRIRTGGIIPYEILTASQAKETLPDPAWTEWKQPSWDAVSDSLERILARRENRKELPRAAIGRQRRPWHMKRVMAAYREWMVVLG